MTAPDEMHAWMIDQQADTEALMQKQNQLEDSLVDLRADHETLREQFSQYLIDMAVREEVSPPPVEPVPDPAPPVVVNDAPAPPGTQMTITTPGTHQITEPVDVVSIQSNGVVIRNESRINLISYANGIDDTEIYGGSVGSILAEGISISRAYWHHMQMDGHYWGTAFNVSGTSLRLEAINAVCARYAYYQSGGAGVAISDCTFRTGTQEACVRFEGVNNVEIVASTLESHFKACLRVHGASSLVAFRNGALIGRWVQSGNHTGDDVRGLILEKNEIRLDPECPYMVLDRRTIAGFEYTENRHHGWASYTGSLGTVEQTYGDMIPNGWDIRGNSYL